MFNETDEINFHLQEYLFIDLINQHEVTPSLVLVHRKEGGGVLKM